MATYIVILITISWLYDFFNSFLTFLCKLRLRRAAGTTGLDFKVPTSIPLPVLSLANYLNYI